MEALYKREIIQSPAAIKAWAVFAGIVLMAESAFVRIPLPFTPVPITLQTLVVLAGAAVLGRRLGSLVQAGYVALGAAGLPIFTNAGSGLLYLTGPTAGYVWGFFAATALLGFLLPKARHSAVLSLGCFLAADAALFLCGAAWLKWHFNASVPAVLAMGVIPFIPGEVVKISAAWLIYRSVVPRVRQN